MKRFMAMLLAVVLILGLAACNAKNNTSGNIRLGTSSLTMTLPDGYQLTAHPLQGDQVAYYAHPEGGFTITVSQWAKKNSTLEKAAQARLESPYSVNLGQISAMCKVTQEITDSAAYTHINYVLDGEPVFIGLTILTDGSTAQLDMIGKMLATLH